MDSDDDLQLSNDTLAALKQFMVEKDESDKKFQELQKNAQEQLDKVKLSMIDFKEDWQLSQFWYTEETARVLGQEAIDNTPIDGTIGCIGSPSVYVALKQLPLENRKPFVFEFDTRFDIFQSEFIFYDYNEPLKVPEMQLDFVVVDPPFLSKECWLKTAKTVKAVLKPGGKILVATGRIMTDLILQELGCTPTGFEPLHRNGLSNEFGSFTNYPSRLSADTSG